MLTGYKDSSVNCNLILLSGVVFDELDLWLRPLSLGQTRNTILIHQMLHSNLLRFVKFAGWVSLLQASNLYYDNQNRGVQGTLWCSGKYPFCLSTTMLQSKIFDKRKDILILQSRLKLVSEEKYSNIKWKCWLRRNAQMYFKHKQTEL